MDWEKQWKNEIQKRSVRSEIEQLTSKDFELLKEMTLMLFDQNEGHKRLLLEIMRQNLIG